MGDLLDRIFVIVIYVLTGNVAPHLYMYMHAKWMEFGLDLFVPKNFVQYVTEKFPYRVFWVLISYLFCLTTLDSLSIVQTSFLPKPHTQLLMFALPWTGLAISVFENHMFCHRHCSEEAGDSMAESAGQLSFLAFSNV